MKPAVRWGSRKDGDNRDDHGGDYSLFGNPLPHYANVQLDFGCFLWPYKTQYKIYK